MIRIDRCDTCTSAYLPIPTDGPVDARVYIYGERPGQNEEYSMRKQVEQGCLNRRRVFIGDSGREFNENYLSLAGLDREDVRVGNVVMCGAEMNRHPSDGDIARCSQYHVGVELAQGNPEVVILQGGSACKLVPDIDLEAEHGIPRKGEILGWSGWVVPMFHPAAGMHDTRYMIPLLDDWEKLGVWLRTGKWQWPVDEYADRRDYRLAETKRDIIRYFTDNFIEIPWIGGDSETHAYRPFSVQVSTKPGTGLMVMLDAAELIKEFRGCLGELVGACSHELIFHNQEADLDIFESVLGHREFAYRDTMQEIYQLQLGPKGQGLKELSLRMLGRKRKSWDEVVGQISKDRLCDWLHDRLMEVCEQYTIVPRVSEKTGKPIKPKIVPHPDQKPIEHVLKHTLGSSKYDPWKKLVEFGYVGGVDMPLKGIANMERGPMIDYACSDADDTLRLALLFDKMRREFVEGLNVQEEDVDV